MTRSSQAGVFIVFEGVDGAGKTTQLLRAQEWLRGESRLAGRELVFTREPGGTALGEAIRGTLMAPQVEPMSPWAELLLMAAARAQHVAELLRPAVERGAVVVCDRYSGSTVAYQGAARGLPLVEVEAACRLAEQGLRPDLTVFLDLSVEAARERMEARSASQGGCAQEEPTRFDREREDFHQRVRSGYHALYRREPDRVSIIDAAQPPEQVWQAVRASLEALLFR